MKTCLSIWVGADYAEKPDSHGSVYIAAPCDVAVSASTIGNTLIVVHGQPEEYEAFAEALLAAAKAKREHDKQFRMMEAAE